MVLINWEDNLNQTQLDAVSNTDGALLVIAGAGSGKTRVLTYRVAYLIHEKNVSPESIMAITFTNKAANEMKERIIDLVGKRRYHPWVGTFHRTCANILRNYGASAGLLDSFTIFDDSEQLVVLKRVFKKLDTVPEPFKPRYYLHMISGAKSHLKPPEQLEEEAKTTFEKKVANVYHHYQESLREQNAYDFDDLISETCMLLQNHKPTRDILRNQYKYILVDEFQDINPSQYAFIKLMANPETRNIFAVGDDDQSIYGWRYADPKFMDNFQEEFAPVTIIKLEENYRSTAPILRVANEVIKNKSWGITKKLHTRKRSGLMPSFYMAGDENKEARYIARQINKHLDDGGNYSDIAILYRMNAQSRSFEEYFSMNGIPFRIIGGLRFYQRMEIKDILSYFRVLANHHDRSSLDRAINTPKRGIGDKSKDRIFNFMSQNRLGLFDLPTNEDILLSMGLQNAIVNRLIPFLELMHEFRDKSKKLKHVDLLSWIIKRTKYEELLEIEDTIEARARIDNLNELRGAFLSFQDNFPDRSLSEFLEHVALVSDIDSYEKTDDSVTMMTLHTAKGLEFDTVFLPGLEEKFLPHSRSQDTPDELDEERRLFYVGVTRAKNVLRITSAKRRLFRGVYINHTVSRFLTEMPLDIINGLDMTITQHGKDDEDTNHFPNFKRESKAKQKSFLDFDDDIEPMPSDEEVIVTRDESKQQKHGKQRKPQLASQYKVGNKISHPKFGQGEIVRINPVGGDDNFLTIQFDDKTGKKVFSEQKAPIEKLD
ncbi:UvrD-helicase domain-containing protein [bacterium]|nr:UvrD-helicase domain-containing protein [bacterium]